MNINPYTILGVDKKCEHHEIKKAYRKLQLQYHPDRNSTDIAKIKIHEINTAYELIGLPEDRNIYDVNANTHELDEIVNSIGEIIDLWFPSKLFVNQTKKPIPIFNYELITLEQSYHGCTIPIIIKKWVIQSNHKTNVEETVYIDIPQGAKDNEFIIIRDVGNCFDQLLGDVKVFIIIQNLTKFRRNELDLYYKKTLTLKESLCGFAFDVLHLNGENYHITNLKKITLITPTYTVKLSKLGMMRENSIGNLIIEFEIEYPILTMEQIAKLQLIL